MFLLTIKTQNLNTKSFIHKKVCRAARSKKANKKDVERTLVSIYGNVALHPLKKSGDFDLKIARTNMVIYVLGRGSAA